MDVNVIRCQFMLYRMVGSEMNSGICPCGFPVYAQ
jgi:hypothetical protein